MTAGPATAAAVLRTRRTRLAGHRRMLVYVAALCAIEVGLFARGHVLLGGVADAIVCAGIVISDIVCGPPRGTATDRERIRVTRACRALVPVALVRVLALGLPLHRGSAATATAVLALVTVGLCVWLGPAAGVYGSDLFRRGRWRPQIVTAAAGVPLGLVAFMFGAPRLVHAGTGGPVVAYTIACAALGATAEEVLYRGLVQQSMERVVRDWGVLLSGVLFAAAYAADVSFQVVLVLAVAGWGFGYSVSRTRCLAGAVGGHIAFTVTAGWLCPTVIPRAAGTLHGLLALTVWMLCTVAAAMFLLRDGGRRTRRVRDVIGYALAPLPRSDRETLLALALDLARRAAADDPETYPHGLPDAHDARATTSPGARLPAVCALGDGRADVLERLEECGPVAMRRPAMVARSVSFVIEPAGDPGAREPEPNGSGPFVEVRYWLASDADGAPVAVAAARPKGGEPLDLGAPFLITPSSPDEVDRGLRCRASERPFVLDSRVPLAGTPQAREAETAGRLVLALLATRLLWDVWDGSAQRRPSV